MKKFLFPILVLACLLGLCACGQPQPTVPSAQPTTTPPAEIDLACGTYQDGIRSWMILKPGEKFEFWYNTYMSAFPSGTYEVRDGKIYATSDQVFSGSVYVFEIIDNETIRFCKAESAEIEVEDGAVYKLGPLKRLVKDFLILFTEYSNFRHSKSRGPHGSRPAHAVLTRQPSSGGLPHGASA